MTINLTVTVETAEELRSALIDLGAQSAQQETKKKKAKKAEVAVPVVEINEAAVEEEEPATMKIPDVVEIRDAAREKATTPEGKAAIKALLGKYEFNSISTIPEDKRAAFLQDVKAL